MPTVVPTTKRDVRDNRSAVVRPIFSALRDRLLKTPSAKFSGVEVALAGITEPSPCRTTQSVNVPPGIDSAHEIFLCGSFFRHRHNSYNPR